MKTQILFDNDGVLVDTEHWYYTASAEILKTMGFHLSENRYREIMINGQSAFLIAEEAGVPISETDQWRARRNELYQHYLRTEEIAIPGVREVLAELSSRYRMGIVTSALRCDFELIHASRGITDHMAFVLCSGEYPRAKPYPDPYLLGLERLGGEKHETIIVEDSERGLRSAVGAGIECVIVHNRFTESHDFSAATHRIKTLNELITLLK
jgi:HAD superfamily hydrolase (TIGR01509 family)